MIGDGAGSSCSRVRLNYRTMRLRHIEVRFIPRSIALQPDLAQTFQ